MVLFLFVLLLHLRSEERTDGFATVLRSIKLLFLPGDGVHGHVAELGALLKDELKPSGLFVHQDIGVASSWLSDIKQEFFLLFLLLVEVHELIFIFLPYIIHIKYC